VRGDDRPGPAPVGDVPGGGLGGAQAFVVDVVQGDGGVLQLGEGEEVGEQALGEDDAPGCS
jgi:hypothetical protein